MTGAMMTSDDDFDEIIDESMQRVSDSPRRAMCPNPSHEAGWHGLPWGGCPGSHLTEWPEMPEKEEDDWYTTYGHLYVGLWPVNITDQRTPRERPCRTGNDVHSGHHVYRA